MDQLDRAWRIRLHELAGGLHVGACGVGDAVQAACDLLVAGADRAEVALVAAEAWPFDDPRLAGEPVQAMLDALGVGRSDDASATEMLVGDVLRLLLDGDLPPELGAARLAEIDAWHDRHELAAFGELAEEWWDLPQWSHRRRTDDELRVQIRAAAAEHLAWYEERRTRRFSVVVAGAECAEFLGNMLVLAANWRPGAASTRDELLARPEFARYVAGWDRPTDIGRAARASDGMLIGAAWLRLFTDDEPGFGYVGRWVPELSIAVVPERRGQGVGTELLRDVLETARSAGIPAVSLSVEHDNPARELYVRQGFVTFRSDTGAATMALRLPEPTADLYAHYLEPMRAQVLASARATHRRLSAQMDGLLG